MLALIQTASQFTGGIKTVCLDSQQTVFVVIIHFEETQNEYFTPTDRESDVPNDSVHKCHVIVVLKRPACRDRNSGRQAGSKV